jgi:hypothetical protein
VLAKRYALDITAGCSPRLLDGLAAILLLIDHD